MRLRLECDVSSQTTCDEILSIELENGNVLMLYPNESGILYRIAIEASTSTWETSTSSIPEQRTLQVAFKVDEQLKETLLTDLRFVESALCMYGVHALNWRNVVVSLVPETPQEADQLQATSSQHALKYDDTPRTLKTHLLRDCFRPLTVPLSFYREGEVLFRDFRYISSFRNFYYILEGFYAAGTHRNQEREFKKSKELIEAVRTALQQLAGGDHEARIHGLLDRYRKMHSAEGVLELLVLLRHDVQHYFGLTKKHAYADGEAGEDFRSAALLAMLVSIQVIWKKVDALQRALC
jgi:hypothetical protein